MEGAQGDQTELKGGHPPAQKVGGMRVVQHRSAPEKEPAPKPSSEEKEEFGEDKVVKAASSVVVSGAKINEEAAFPTDAVRAFHDKPQPTHDKGHTNKPKVIQQPRK